MKGLVIELFPSLLFGPPPKTRDDLKYLIDEMGVSLIINICPKTNERTKKGVEKAEYYMELLKAPKKRTRDEDPEEEQDEEEELSISMDRIPVDMTSFDPKGRNKGLKQESTAQYYVSYARSIYKKLQGKNRVYLHGTSGAMEEAYIAFAIWKMHASDFPEDIIAWIKEKDYEWLFNDDTDKKHLLTVVLSETTKDLRRTYFFKRHKTSDENP